MRLKGRESPVGEEPGSIVDAFSMVFGIQGAGQERAMIIAVVALVFGYLIGLWAMHRWFRGRKLAWALFNLLYVAVFFGTLECVVRVAGPPPHPLLEADASRVWKLRPHLDTGKSGNSAEFNLVITNADGWRNREEITRDHPAGTLRVVCVGDSWMYGFRVDQDDTIPAVLAVELSRLLPGRKVEVINGGVFGYGTGQSLTTLRELMAWHPDVVVVGLLHNVNARAAAIRETAGWRSEVRKVLLQSRLYLWLRVLLQDRGRERDPAQFDRQVTEEARLDYAEMADLARAAGAMCVFLEYRLPFDDWPQIHSIERAENHPPDAFQDSMAAVAAEKGCVLVGCTYCFEPNGTELTDLVHDKYHPNAKGYHWMAGRAAAAIVQALQRKK